MKKNTVKLIALALCLVMALALAACAGETPAGSDTGSNNTADNTPANNTPADNTPADTTPANNSQPAELDNYQLVGKYEEDGEGADRVSAAFKLDLNKDGTAVADRYRYMSDTYEDTFMTGTWAPTQKDGIDCLKIDLACDNNGEKANEQTVYAYDMAGTYSVEISFPIVVGMDYKRNLTVEGTNEMKYDDESFKAAYAWTAPAPEPEPDPAETAANEYHMPLTLGDNNFDAVLTLVDDTNATFAAAMTFNCTYTQDGSVVSLTPAEELEGMKATVWSSVPHELKINDDGTMEAYVPFEGEASPYAGEYDVKNVNGDGEESYFEEFIIDEDGTVHGSVDASGLTGFEGTVDADGNITAEYGRLGGTMTGTVDLEGNITLHSEVRGRESNATGVKF